MEVGGKKESLWFSRVGEEILKAYGGEEHEWNDVCVCVLRTYM